MNGQENKRLDDVREDVAELRKSMQERFNQIETKLDMNLVRGLEKESKERNKIWAKLDDQEETLNDLTAESTARWNDLDKRLFKLFLIGNGVGMVLGSFFTLLVQSLADKI